MAAPNHAREASHARVPGGLWSDAAEPLRTLELRPVTEEDLEFLLDSGPALTPARRANQLLHRCLQPGQRHVVPELTVGDREALLLQLRSLTFGDHLECLVSCPRPECEAVMQVDLDVRDVLLPAYADPRPEHQLTLDRPDGSKVCLRLRLPRAGDLDRVSARTDPDAGAADLLGSCVHEVSIDGSPVLLSALDDDLLSEVERLLAELDPQGEIELALECSECGSAFVVLFDAGTFLLQELDERAAQLLVDVHTLASHYHWQEREILALGPARRARYLDLISASTTAASLWETP